MDMKISFLGRYLKVGINQVVSKHVNVKEYVIKKDGFMEVGMHATTDIDNIEIAKLEDNKNMLIVHFYVEDNMLGGV